MKYIFSLTFFLFVSIIHVNATIWRVNNNAGVDADFTDLSAAVASSLVNNGDTIHIEPSSTTYSNISLTKSLVIIGPGYFLDPENVVPDNPGLQADPRRVYISTMNLDAGAEGSKILGVSFGNLNFRDVTENVAIERCHIQYGISFSQSGNEYEDFSITKCFFQDDISQNSGVVSISKMRIENCIFSGNNSGIRLLKLTGNENVIRNNTIHGRYLVVPNSYFANNIYWHHYVGYGFTYDFTNAVVKNNIFSPSPTLPPTATENLVSVNMATVFVQGDDSFDSYYHLVPGTSPAIGYGVTIAGYTPDIGAFGGPDAYRLSGIPPIPTIYLLTVPNSVNPGDDLEVTFSTRNNN
jgi:hypothetical protein